MTPSPGLSAVDPVPGYLDPTGDEIEPQRRSGAESSATPATPPPSGPSVRGWAWLAAVIVLLAWSATLTYVTLSQRASNGCSYLSEGTSTYLVCR